VGRKKNNPLLEKIVIQSIAAEGKAIARFNDQVVFVPFVVPGDVVDLQVGKKRKKYMEAKAVHFHEYSAQREIAFCKHFGTCGGCNWQILPYSDQLNYKHQQVIDALTRIGKLEIPEPERIMGSAATTEYRNKLEFTFSVHRWLSKQEMELETKSFNALGFHIPGFFDKIIDVEHCYLQPEPSNAIRLAIRDFALQKGYEFYNQRSNSGFLRNIIIRTSTTGEVMVIVIFGNDHAESIQDVMNFLSEKFGSTITSLQYIINKKVNDSYSDLEAIVYKGQDCIYEQMENLKFKIGPKSFYQTNSNQAYQLYLKVREYADLKGNEIVYDLYTGTGTIACFIAGNASKVIGAEYVEDAVMDAKINAQMNTINNVHFFAGDMKDILNEDFIKFHGSPNVIITDPPRAGMHPSVVETIKNCGPEKIVYVSCNPATQARDIDLLKDSYNIIKVQPVDMFPHTHHVENIVLLQKR